MAEAVRRDRSRQRERTATRSRRCRSSPAGAASTSSFEVIGLKATVAAGVRDDAPRRPGDHRRRSQDGTDRWRSRSRWSCSSTRSRSAARGTARRRPAATCPASSTLYKDGTLKLDELVSRRIGLDGINDAFTLDGGGRGRPIGRRLRHLSSLRPCATADWEQRSRRLRGRVRHLDARHRLVGSHRRPARHDHAPRSTPGINFIDTAPVYGADGAGETILRAVPDRTATRSSSRRSAATTSPPTAGSRASRSARTTGSPSRSASSSRRRCARLGTDHIDLLPAAQPAHRADPRRRRSGRRSSTLRDEGKVRELGVALGPAIGWVEEGNRVDRRPADRVAADRVQRARAGARPHVRGSAPACAAARSSLISRVPHASDTLSGKVTPDTVFPTRATTARTATATTCSTTSRRPTTLSFLWEAETGRTIGQAAIAGILAEPGVHVRAPDRALASTRCASTRPRPTCRSPPTKRARSTSCWARNFDHVDRYVMPLKSSV